MATPIGNLDDLSPRARSVLAAVAVVAAEDTRTSGNLLRKLGIRTALVSCHAHNERDRAGPLVARMQSGESVALVTDAGTPAISDPGGWLTAAAHAAGIEVVAVPGPCAAMAALSIAGLDTHRFAFEGFPPQGAGDRRRFYEGLMREMRALVFYESPHRILDSLADAVHVFGETRKAVLARELTKLHETVYRGTLAEIRSRLAASPAQQRGEFVLVLAARPKIPHEAGRDDAAPEAPRLDARAVVRLLLGELAPARAAALASKLTGVDRKTCYELALGMR